MKAFTISTPRAEGPPPPTGGTVTAFRETPVAPSAKSIVMQLTVNGTTKEVPDGLTVRDLVVHLGLGAGPVAVEVNREIVPRAEHATRKVAGGDTIEIVHFVGGG